MPSLQPFHLPRFWRVIAPTATWLPGLEAVQPTFNWRFSCTEVAPTQRIGVKASVIYVKESDRHNNTLTSSSRTVWCVCFDRMLLRRKTRCPLKVGHWIRKMKWKYRAYSRSSVTRKRRISRCQLALLKRLDHSPRFLGQDFESEGYVDDDAANLMAWIKYSTAIFTNPMQQWKYVSSHDDRAQKKLSAVLPKTQSLMKSEWCFLA